MTKRLVFAALAAGAVLFGTSIARAKEYVDYGYGKGIWNINQIEVDPNHIDDYLTGLKRSQIPGFEIMKRHGIIDDYSFMVRNGYTKGAADVMIGVHYVSADGLMPNPTRDQMIEKEIYATFSEEAGKVAVAGYEKYRQFLDNATWLSVTFKK